MEAVRNISIAMEHNLSKYFDHTILKFDTSIEDIKQICNEALEYQFAAVCIPPFFIKQAKDLLIDSKVLVATVVGFPLGYSHTIVKLQETKLAILDGADEIDMVVNVSAMKSGDWEYVQQDILTLNELCHDHKVILKVIIESSLISDEEIVKLCEICSQIKVDFVKTSTGFNGQGAQVKDVQLMRANLPESIKIKASGGIRTKASMSEMIEAGASRIGASSSVKIIQE